MFALGRSTSLPSHIELDNLRQKFIKIIENAESFIGNHKKLSSLLLDAKAEFTTATAKFNESDANYIHRIKSFLYWYLLDWQLPAPAHAIALNYFLDSLHDNSELELAKQLVNNEYSLFRFDKIKGNVVKLKNLYNDEKIDVAYNEFLGVLSNGDWFETRIFNINSTNIMADYLILHPAAVFKQVKKEIKNLKHDKQAFKDFILRLQGYYVRWSSYKMIDVESIYKLGN